MTLSGVSLSTSWLCVSKLASSSIMVFLRGGRRGHQQLKTFCLATLVESKLHFPKHLVNFQKMLIGSRWPGLGHGTPAELITMSRENGVSGSPLELWGRVSPHWVSTRWGWRRGGSPKEKPEGGRVEAVGKNSSCLP